MGRKPRFALFALVLSGFIVASCGGGGGAKQTAVPTQTSPAAVTTPGTPAVQSTPKTPIPTVTPHATRTPAGSAEDEAAIITLVDRGLVALQARDSAAFQALFPSGAAPSDTDLNALYVCMATATRTADAPSILYLSNLARVTLKFNKTTNGQTSTVEGVWEVQKLPGSLWVFYATPFCPQ